MVTQVRQRAFELDPGDQLICERETGSFHLVKTSGEQIDLNALRVDATKGSGEMMMRTMEPLDFLQLCSILAASYGLSSNEVEYDFKKGTYTCVVRAPSEKAS